MDAPRAPELEDLVLSPFAGQLVAAMPEPAMLVDREGRVAAANPPALALLSGLKVGDSLVLALRAPDVVDARRRVLASGEAETVLWSERVPVERLFEVAVAPLVAANGAVAATLLTLRDLTELRRVERHACRFHRQRQPRIAHAARLAARLHRDPARVGARRFESARPLSRDHARAGAAHGAADRRSAVAVAHRAEAARPPGYGRRSRPDDARTSSTPSPRWRRNSGSRSDSRPQTRTLVLGDRDELVRVAENLIENAIKYGVRTGEAGGLVEVTVAAKAKDAALSVRDHGHGIAPEHLPRLTERFYRVDPGQSRAKNGTGLGLAIVKHILTRHRGRLTIASRLGQGSQFTANVPLHSETKITYNFQVS